MIGKKTTRKQERYCKMHQSSQLVIAIFAAVILPSILAFSQEHENFDILKKLLSRPQKPERHVSPKDLKHPQSNSPMVMSFNWKSCGPATDPISANVSLSPDPLPIPGTITVAANASLKVDVTAPVKLALSIQKKVLVWIPIPCVDNLGSCTYDDVCEMLDESFPPSDPCPDPLAAYNLPCHCPFKAGNYILPASQIVVEDTGLPSWLTSGDYQVKAVASDSSGNELACFSATVTLN